MPSWRARVVGGRFVLLALFVYILLRPVIGLGHELAIWIVAAGLHAFASSGLWEPIIGFLGLDPIYLGAAVHAAGGVDVAGLAIAAPIGGVLHAIAPWAVLAPDRVVPGAAISLVAASGTPVLGRDLARLGSDVIMLALGIWLVRGWGASRTSVGLLGWLIQGQVVVNHLLDRHVHLADLDASGLPFAVATAQAGGSGSWFTDALQQWPDPVQTGIVGGAMVLVAYACALLIVFTPVGTHRLWQRVRFAPRAREVKQNRRTDAQTKRATHRRPVGLTLAGASVAIATAISPIGAVAIGLPNFDGTGVPWAAAGRVDRLDSVSATAGPSHVQVVRDADGTWQYLVNGTPEVLRGVGYNPQYAGLPDDQRAQLYQRDFSAMRQLGINTIEGWFEPQFDQVTLDAAARNGIGVLMPFELNQDWPYDNPNVQQSILDHVSAYVEKYKDDPAVRMWAPGNEDLHRILYPHLRDQGDNPAVRAQADAFAAFLPRLVDRVHELDPNHPVIYRDAEDVYLPRLKASFEATGVDRPWLVYGANVYAEPRLQQIISAWPSQFLDMPLVISEYAPGGDGPTQRPLGYQEDWATIRSRPGVVLGGLAYTWATNGPEQLDRVFGLVDAQGVPTDGALAALSAAYLNDLRASGGGSTQT